MQQQKVLHNLKQLNQVAEAKRATVIKKVSKEPEIQTKGSHKKQSSQFKTVDDSKVDVTANYNKKKKIVNIQVKPESHRDINKHIMAQQISNHP